MNYKRRRCRRVPGGCACKSGKLDGNHVDPIDLKRSKTVPEMPRVWPGRKDTKRWCRGKVGREHTPRWVPRWPRVPFSPDWMEFACSACGKVLDYCYSSKAVGSGCKCGSHYLPGYEKRVGTTRSA